MITNYLKTLQCRRFAPLLFAKSQNAELSPSDAAKLSAHLAGCVSCQTEAAQFARMALDLRQATPAAPLPSADLWSRIQSEITTDTPRVSPLPQQRRPAPFAPRLGGLAWAGSAAIVFVGGAWMTYGAGFWGHGGNNQSQLPSVTGAVSSDRASVTLIPPASVLASSAASNTGTMAKAVTKKASRSEAVSIARQTAPPVRSSLEARPDPFVPVSAAPLSKSTISGTFANRARISRTQQTNATLFGDLARLQTRDAREAGRNVTGKFAATTNIPGFDGRGTASRNGLTSSEAVVEGSNTAASAAPSAFEGEQSATVAAVVPTATATPTGVESAAPLGVSAAFAYSAMKPTADLERASDAPALDDAEPRSIPPAGSGGAFSVGESTSRMRRQRALFSYGRP